MQSIRNPVMTLITKAQMAQLEKAGYQGSRPIVKLFMGRLTWLVTGIENGILYGYADLGMQCVEWGGLIHASELPTLKIGPAYLERDYHFADDPSVKWLEKESLVGA